MEDFILKGVELGGLGMVTMFLLIKGTAVITKFSDSVNALAAAVAQLANKVNNLDERVNMINLDNSARLAKIERRLDELCEQFHRHDPF